MSGTGKINDFVQHGTSLMVEVNKYLQEKDAKEYAQKSFKNIRKQNVELLEQIERLQEQLHEANELISLLFPLSINKERALERTTEYMEKWGVK